MCKFIFLGALQCLLQCVAERCSVCWSMAVAGVLGTSVPKFIF